VRIDLRVGQCVSVDSWRHQYSSAYAVTVNHVTGIGDSYGL
jgi:hypothetical protein